MSDQESIFSGISVLAVDDNLPALMVIKNSLLEMGVTQVFTAKNGREALDFLDFEMPDLILCDWAMPSLSGLEVLQQVRSCDPDIPFMMITGNADQQSVLEAKSYNVTGYIVKPFSKNELAKKMQVMARLIKHRRSQ